MYGDYVEFIDIEGWVVGLCLGCIVVVVFGWVVKLFEYVEFGVIVIVFG